MDSRRTIVDAIYLGTVKRRNAIIRMFLVSAYALVAVLIIGGRSIYLKHDNWYEIYKLGVLFGKIAVILFVLTLIPGIVRRFGQFNKMVSLLMIFRRYIGILMYLSALTHFSWVKFLPSVSRGISWLPSMPFEVFGSLSLTLLLPVFLTSNDLSVGKFGIWWHRIHALVYVVMFTILLHVGLQRMSIWTILTGAVTIAEIASFVVSAIRKKKAAAIVTPMTSSSDVPNQARNEEKRPN